VRYEGSIGLIHENDKDECAARERIRAQIEDVLRVPAPVKFWKKF
jgi:hypothetical protein